MPFDLLQWNSINSLNFMLLSEEHGWRMHTVQYGRGFLSQAMVVQIGRGYRNSLGIIFLNAP